MDHLVRMLKASTLFCELPEKTIKNDILSRGRIVHVLKGNHLITFQEKVDHFGIVLTGKINLLHIYGNGNYGIVGVLEPGDTWGTDLIFTKTRISPYYAQAAQPAQVLSFPMELLRPQGSMEESTRLHIMEKLLMLISDENIRKEYRLAILFQKGIRDRIMTFLTMQANKRKTNTFSVPFTRDEMASYLCVNRSCLSHELSLMEREGILKFNRNVFTLLHWDADGEDY